MKVKKIILDGNNLSIKDLAMLVSDPSVVVAIAERAKKRVCQSKHFLDQQLKTDKIIYGMNTGFGPMASHIIGKNQLAVLQENLIKSHAVGLGESIPSSLVLAGMVVRLNTMLRGYSGISAELAERMAFFINQRIIPVVPEHGAVGTSGDLVQLAHIALGFLGGGEVFYKGRRRLTVEVMRKLKIPPLALQSREGLALINGTALMTGIAALLWVEMDRSLGLAVRLGGWGLELVEGFNDGLAERLHELRPHAGQVLVAKTLRRLLSSSERLQDRSRLITQNFTEDVLLVSEEIQQVYSLRCMAQILGPTFDTLERAKKTIEIELNAVTDNPIIDWERKKIWHGGNFHGEYIAALVDQMKIGLVKLTMLSERRINFFLNARLNKIFPPFMNLAKPGLTLGLQGLQFVATSTAAQSQTLGFPHHLHSIPTNSDNQDVVSMGADAALLAVKVAENALIVLAVEMIVMGQGTDFLGLKGFSQSSREIYRGLRRIFPAVRNDRVITKELSKIMGFIKTSPLLLVTWPKHGKEDKK